MKNSKLVSVLATSAAAAALLLWTGVAKANDCSQVKFHFHNEVGSKIKVRGVEIVGNDGTWTEDINNEEINTNGHYTTGPRRLNKLDSGAQPSSMTVDYDKWDAKNGEWVKNKAMKFTNRPACSDGYTYNFDMK